MTIATSPVTCYTQALVATYEGGINWTAATIKCALLSNSYTPAVNTDSVWSGISSNEISATNYTAGGNAISAATVTASGGVVTWTSSGATWTSVTLSARYAVIYDSATGKLLAYYDLTGSGTILASPINGTLSTGTLSATITHTP